MTNFEQALLDPTSVFSEPEDVLQAKDLTREQKIEVLKRWEYDARELEVAADENMSDDSSDLLGRVLKSLDELGYDPDPDNDPSTKQGGV